MPAVRRPPSNVEVWPVTGTVRLSDSLRRVLSLVPVHTSTVAFLIAAPIFCWVAAGIDDGIFVVPELFAVLARKVLRSARRAVTLTPARMCVVDAPPTVSVPTTDGFVSQCSGSIPKPARLPWPLPEEPTEEKLDSRRWKSDAGS